MCENELRQFLKEYDCENISLFDFVLECKNVLKKRYPEKMILPIKLETSIKKFDIGKIVKGRYSITLPMVEFANFLPMQQYKLFNMFNFDIGNFSKFFEDVRFTQICFGGDNGKGKIYFGNGTNLYCFETDGLVKQYKFITPGWMEVSNIQSLNKVISVYKIIKEKDHVGWISINPEYITTYYRPDIKLSEDAFNSLSRQDKFEYKELQHWRDLRCRDCSKKGTFKNTNGEEDGKSKEDIIKDVRQKLIRV